MPKVILLNNHNTLRIHMPRPTIFQKVYVPAPIPVPKYFSAKEILPVNRAVIATEYFMQSMPKANNITERINLGKNDIIFVFWLDA